MILKAQRQPTRETCGQTVVAMLLDVDVARASALCGTSGLTTGSDLRRALATRGLTMERTSADTDCGMLPGPYVVRIGNGQSGAAHRSHWMAVHNGLVYDPASGQRFGWSDVERVLRGRYMGWRVTSCWRVAKKLW